MIINIMYNQGFHMHPPLLFLFLLLTAVSCRQASPPLSTEEAKDIERTVRQTLADYNTAVKKEGLMAEFRFLDSSSSFFWVPPGFTTSLGYDSIHSIIQKNASLFASVDNTWQSLKIIPLSKELANYTGRIRSVMKDTSGKINAFTLVETGLVIRRVDGWKLLSGQTAVVAQ
jgi:hypothetical protein